MEDINSKLFEFDPARHAGATSARRASVTMLLAVAILLNLAGLLDGRAFESIGCAQPLPLPDTEFGPVFSGRVVSTYGQPLVGATVRVGSRQEETDEEGFFYMVMWFEMPLDPNQADPKDTATERYVVNISKEGYGPVSKVYSRSMEDGLWILTPATVVTIDPTIDNVITDRRSSSICTGSLSSQVDWSQYAHRRTPRCVDSQGNYVGPASPEAERAVAFAEAASRCNNGISIRIQANTLVDAEGNLPVGRATVSLSTVDIYDPSSMPGDYTVDLGGPTGYMVTYGAGTVSASSGGQSLQLRKGATAKLAIPINGGQLETAGQLDPNIPCLRYDEGDGMWRVVADAVLDPDGMAYIAEIDHLSAFNMDLVKTDQACLRVDSSAIDEDYELEVSLTYQGNNILRTVSVDNTPTKIHVIYNLPSHTDVVLRAFRMDGTLPVPITDTVVRNTGAPQNPQTPNCPAFPYDACSEQVVLTEASVQSGGPVLSGPVPETTTSPFTLTWDYDWPAIVSTNDGYELQESATSAASGFSPIYDTVGSNDHRSHVEHAVTGSDGHYWYRVRARDEVGYPVGRYSPWSNVVHVHVQAGMPTTLRVINDLYSTTDAYENDWYKLNGIVRVRVGPSIDSVVNQSSGELMSRNETTVNIAETLVLPPAHNQDTSYADFDVSGVTLSSAGRYYILIQVGWWDWIFDPFTFEFLYWERRNTNVLDCNGNCCIEKWSVVEISRPFYHPEVIRASDYLPQQHWMGHETCP